MANKFDFSYLDKQSLQLVGDLTRHTIVGKQQKYFAILTSDAIQVVDFTKVNRVDTAGLAWLLSLLEYAATKQIKLTYSQAPIELVKLAQLSHVQHLLPLTNAQ